MRPLETALRIVSIFSRLRPDEIARIAQRVSLVELEAGESRTIEASIEAARLVIVVSGELSASLEDPIGIVHERMYPGDRYGEDVLITGNPKAVQLTALKRSKLALIDHAGFWSILAEFPAVAIPLVRELASELRARNEQVRQVLELIASGLDRRQIDAATRSLKRSLVLRSVGMRRLPTRGIFRRLVIARGKEPPFWMLMGFLSGLLGARLVVHFIIKFHLEKELCALVAGPGPNPMHIHHFNYGLLLVGIVGLAALSPWGRRPLRTLALLFGFGCGLTFDEFALFWNLRPDYYQGLSLISAAIVAILLIQLTYFRTFWWALLNRVVQKVHGE